MLKSYQKYLEDSGLGDVKGNTDFNGSESEILNQIGQLLRDNSDVFQRIFQKTLHTVKMSTDEENSLKNFIGLVANLKESPKEKQRQMRDPLDNVVIRAPNGGTGGDGGGEN